MFNRKLINIAKEKVTNLLCVIFIYLIYSQSALAAKVDPGDKTWGSFYTQVLSLFTGTSGAILSLVALIAGIFGALFTQHKIISITAGICIPFAIQFGPAIFIGLSGALI